MLFKKDFHLLPESELNSQVSFAHQDFSLTACNKNFNSTPVPNHIFRLLLFFGLLKVVIHLFALSGYGLHADELYYISLGKHFEWGFLDISPFVSWMASLSSMLFEESTSSWRFIPVLFSAFTVMITGLLAYFMGAKKLGVSIACISIICSPAYLATSYLLQPVVFDEFFWTISALMMFRFSQTSKSKYLYLLAVVAGIGLLNKYTILFYFISIGIGILIAYKGQQKINWRKIIGPLLVFIIILWPNLLWQYKHHFPIFGYSRLVGKNAFSIDVPDYLFQLIFFHGASVAVWTAGFFYLLLVKSKNKSWRMWPVSMLIVLLILMLLKGKLYYGLGVFPLFFAAGGRCWEIMLQFQPIYKKVWFIFMITLIGLLSLPLVIPVFSIEVCRTYARNMVAWTGFSRPMVWEDGSTGTIPQFFADMAGWEAATQKVENVANQIKAKKGKKYVLTDNYAIAGALKLYGQAQPSKIISVGNSFILESPSNVLGATVIYLSKDALPKVRKLASRVTFYEELKVENSHLNGIKIYILYEVNEQFNDQYKNTRKRFYSRVEG